MRKRLISLLLVFCMLFTLIPPIAFAETDGGSKQEPAKNFVDVPDWEWYYDSINYAVSNGFFNGTTEATFEPDGTMTRGMFVTVLARMAGVDADKYSGETKFEDVPLTEYYAPYVKWAEQYGITTGTVEGQFSPDEMIDREQMATFYVRYFDKMEIEYETEDATSTLPADMHLVEEFAETPVTNMWQSGLVIGDGVNFDPLANASRSQMATICQRTDEEIDVWYSEPGVVGRKKKQENYSNTYSVYFYDGNRKIDTLYTVKNTPLNRVPDVEKSSKEGSILLGYFTDPEFTEPFYANEPVTNDTKVYAQYHEMGGAESLNITTFSQMDQDPDISFNIQKEYGSIRPEDAATLVVKDGTDPVEITAADTDGDGIYTVYAPDGFIPGSSYELVLGNGWNFAGKPETIRTASFSIYRDEVEKMQLNDSIIYIKDTEAITYTVKNENYDVITNNEVTSAGGIMKGYAAVNDSSANNSSAAGISADDSSAITVGAILCIYTGVHPEERTDSDLLDPAVYVEVTGVSGSNISFVALDDEAQQKLYEVPDNFPLLVAPGEVGTGTADILSLDISMYENMMGSVDGTLANAKSKINAGDFVTIYAGEIDESTALYFGRITDYDAATGIITYVQSSKDEILTSMDLYSNITVQGSDLVTDEEREALEEEITDQVQNSEFPEQAAQAVADLVTQTDNFRNNPSVQEVLLTDENGNPLTDEEIQLLGLGGSFELSDDIELKVELVTDGEQLHFGDSVQLAISIDAELKVEAEDGTVNIDLSATFVQEVHLAPRVKGGLVYKEILGIPIPIGVHVGADVDILSYTALSFNAEIYTVEEEEKSTWDKIKSITSDPTELLGLASLPEGLATGLSTVSDVMDKIDEIEAKIDQATATKDQLKGYAEDLEALWGVIEGADLTTREDWETMGETLGKTHITSDLMEMMNLTDETGISAEYLDSMQALMDKYSEMLSKETDWITLVEQEIFTFEVCYFGLAIGVETDFVVRADMSIAIGSNLEYEVGKRYSFWFEIGLFTPTAGNSSMDLIDEHFAFQFYVMGKLGVKAGVKAKLYVGLGSGKLASVGISAELGPYIKLWGFFVYEYEKYRPANSQKWTITDRMAGALALEFGLYFIMGFEAEALSLFEYSYEFLDEEIPLLESGEERYYYNFNYEAEEDEIVRILDEDNDSTTGYTMKLADEFWGLHYVDLKTGVQGVEVLDNSNYHITMSNPNFKLEEDGRTVSVEVPDRVRYMECDMTITYLQGKMAFSEYDMSVTVPLVWTNLATSELNEYYYASVRVGNDIDGYDTVWTKKVLKNQQYDLPTDAEIKEMIGWSDTRYKAGTGYNTDQLTDLTLVENTVYDYNVDFQDYTVTVTGIQSGEPTRTFTAPYGRTFDFSSLNDTGKNDPSSGTYTKFVNVTTEQTVTVNGKTQVIDLTQPISGKMAEALLSGVTATANYADNSAKAVFTFNGITHDDVVVKTEKGTVPDMSSVQAVVDAAGENLAIQEVSPAVGKIDNITNYVVTCVELTGERADIEFISNEGTPVDPINRLVGSLIVNLPKTERIGYTFGGWQADEEWTIKAETQTLPAAGTALGMLITPPVEDDPADTETTSGAIGGEDSADIETTSGAIDGEDLADADEGVSGEFEPVLPAEFMPGPNTGIVLYAKWTPNDYWLTFHVNGGESLTDEQSQKLVTYDSQYGSLPKPSRTGYGFIGWFTEAEGGVQITADNIVKITEDTTLYAHWRRLVDIPSSVFYFGTQETGTYSPGTTHAAVYIFVENDVPVINEEGVPEVKLSDFEIRYKRQGADEYEIGENLPENAGVYDIRVIRPGDDYYSKTEHYYEAVLRVYKAQSTIHNAPSVKSIYSGYVIPDAMYAGSDYTGDGKLQYAITKDANVTPSGWTDGMVYNAATSAGDYYLWVRLTEGLNYEASSAKHSSSSFNISDPVEPLIGEHDGLTYKLVIHTADEGNAGTDSTISAKIGDGDYKHLDGNGNDFERDDTDSYSVSFSGMKNHVGSIPVTIRYDKSGTAAGWKLGWIRIDVYKNGNCVRSSDQCNIYYWFDDGDETQTYTVTGLEPDLSGEDFDLSISEGYWDTEISMGSSVTDETLDYTYDPYKLTHAPQLFVSFSHTGGDDGFDRFVTRESLYKIRLDEAGIRDAMEEYRIDTLKITYGVKWKTGSGMDYYQKELVRKVSLY